MWQKATEVLSRRRLSLDDSIVEIRVDWSPVVRRLRLEYRADNEYRLASSQEEREDALELYKIEPIRLNFNVDILFDKRPSSHIHFYAHFIEYYLYDLFLIMNISYPGSCNFRNVVVNPENQFSSNINLDNYRFDFSWSNSKQIWPKINNIDIDIVIDWMNKVRGTLRMISKSRSEKALFAVLHICRMEPSPSSIIWIFYALESLFDTKTGENFRALVGRISLLLSPDQEQTKSMKKKLRELYDLRSSFVHGGLEVIHPMHNELFDKRVDELFGRLIDTTDFGFQIIIASIQSIISRKWIEPDFGETLSGLPL